MNSDNIITLNNTQDSIPLSAAGTGTVTSVNNKMFLTGVGTLFLAEARVGDFIYIKAQNEFARIETIVSDTELYLNRKFTVDLAADAYDITPYSTLIEISAAVDAAGDAEIDGQTIPAGASVSFTKVGDRNYGQKFVAPLDIDATGTSVIVTIQG